MSSKWSRQRRQKRKYEGYLREDVPVAASTSDRPSASSLTATGEDESSRYRPASKNSGSANVERGVAAGSVRGSEEIDVAAESHSGSDDSVEHEIISSFSGTSNTSDSSDSEIETDGDQPVTRALDKSTDTQSLIRDWAIKHQITHSALRELLEVLKNRYDSDLPSDPRTLCRTPSHLSSQIKKKCGGEYYHFGLKNSIQEFLDSLSCVDRSKITSVFLKINCDGIPLFKSSGKQFWPLLVQCCIDREMRAASEPFPVGIFVGDAKPNNLGDYVKDFVEEMVELRNGGFEYRGARYSVVIQCFICDAPARQFLKCIVSHTGYNGCERCTQHGEYNSHAMTFPELGAQLRTDDSFISRTESDHHKGTSPLVELGVGLVTQFVLDPMHLLYLGVMRKLFHLWLKGPLSTRIGTQCKERISTKLVELAKFMPSEFSRKPRSLNDLDRYKATEYRAFLLYTGPICLKRSVDENIYKNFLLLSASTTLLSLHSDPQNLDVAKQYIIAFIKHFELLYGTRHLVYNIHSLSHLTDDVRKFGSIDKISAFPFENYLGTLKKLLRKPNAVLSQVINRIFEMKSCKPEKKVQKYPVVKQEHNNGPVPNNELCVQFRALYLEKFCIRLNPADHGIMVNSRVGRVVNIMQYEADTEIHVLYHLYKVYEDLYDYPVKSGSLGIFVVSDQSKTLKSCSHKEIQSKYILFPLGDKVAAFPLIHTNHQQ